MSPLESIRSVHQQACLIIPLCLCQGHRGGFPGPGGQPGYSVHDEGFSVCQSLWAGGGLLGTPAVPGAGSHRDDPHCATSVDLSGGIANILIHYYTRILIAGLNKILGADHLCRSPPVKTHHGKIYLCLAAKVLLLSAFWEKASGWKVHVFIKVTFSLSVPPENDHSSLVLLFLPLSSYCHQVIIIFLFSVSYTINIFPRPQSFSVIVHFSFFSHHSSTFFRERISGNSCPPSAKSLKTLVVVGRPSWADCTRITKPCREHITPVWHDVFYVS